MNERIKIYAQELNIYWILWMNNTTPCFQFGHHILKLKRTKELKHTFADDIDENSIRMTYELGGFFETKYFEQFAVQYGVKLVQIID